MASSRLHAGAVATVAGILGVLGSSTAHAYCRYLTTTPAAWNPVSQGGCFEGDGIEPAYILFWNQICVGYSIQQDASRYVTLSDATALAGEAFLAWTSATCSGQAPPSVQAINNAPVACNILPTHQNAIIFRDDGWPAEYDSSWLALTSLTFYINTNDPNDPKNGQILGADMEINESDYRLVANPDAADASGTGIESFPLLPVLMHEAGHFLGLAHSADTSALMYALYHPSSAAGLTEDDREGICSMALPGGLRLTSNSGLVDANTTCDPTPFHSSQSQCGVQDTELALPSESDASSSVSGASSTVITSDGGSGCSVASSMAPRRSLCEFCGCLVGVAMWRVRRRKGRRG